MKFSHEEYLDGNPAMQEIFQQAMKRIDDHHRLNDVQRIVIREWHHRARAARWLLDDRAKSGSLSREDMEALYELSQTIDQIESEGYV